MSNYTKTTNFAVKDSLPSGDPLKLVKGTEINTEFDNIATAVATKANTASPTFTGTVTIPTVDINAGAIDGTIIGANSAAAITGTLITASTSFAGALNGTVGATTPAAGAFTTLTASGATTLNGDTTIGNASGDALTFHPAAWTLTNAVTVTGTWANLGTVTTADINGGTIDGTTQASGTINGPIAAGGTWTAAATWTLPAHTLGGTVTSNGQSFSGTIANLGTVTTVDINGGTVGDVTLDGTISGTPIWASTQAVNISGSAPAGSLTGTTLAANVVSSSLTSLGTITSLVATTADINGGTIDGATIGGSSAGAGTFTSLTATGAFTSLGIDDNATGEVVDITDSLTTISTNTVVGGTTAGAASAFTAYADGRIGVIVGSSGATASGAADDIVISGSGTSGLSILTPNNEIGYLVFGDPDNAAVGYIEYNHASDSMAFRVAGAEFMRGDSSGNLIVGGTSAGATSAFTAYATGAGKFSTGSSGATASGFANTLVVEHNTTGGLSLLTPDAGSSVLYWGSPTAPAGMEAYWNYSISSGVMGTKKVGASLAFNAGNGITNLTLSGGSGSELATFAKDVTVTGALSKGSGSFKIDHPLKPETHYLVHSFVESPQANNIYRGKVVLDAGQATVNLDSVSGMTEGTFVALNRDIQCFTANESGWTAVRGSVSGNILTIEAQSECADTISWMVIGERQDQHMYDTNWTDENGKVIVEPEKEESV